MEILKGCIPCLLRQAENAAKKVSSDKAVHSAVINDAKNILNNYESYENAPHLAEAIHNAVKKHTKSNDPYKSVKEADIAAATSLIPELCKFIANSDDKIYAALKVSAVGNNLDSAVYNNIDIKECFDRELKVPFTICDIDILANKLKTAKTVLIIGDNAGEAVFDGVFMDNLPNLSYTYATRSCPIINDVTTLEAVQCKVDKKAKIIASGSHAPGSVLSQCTNEFKALLKSCDIVISKGQGNYEALSETKNIFFLLKAKCPVIASRFGVETGSYIFKYNA